MADPVITSLELIDFSYEQRELGTDYHMFNQVYVPGARLQAGGTILVVHSDAGVSGSCAGISRGRR